MTQAPKPSTPSSPPSSKDKEREDLTMAELLSAGEKSVIFLLSTLAFAGGHHFANAEYGLAAFAITLVLLSVILTAVKTQQLQNNAQMAKIHVCALLDQKNHGGKSEKPHGNLD